MVGTRFSNAGLLAVLFLALCSTWAEASEPLLSQDFAVETVDGRMLQYVVDRPGESERKLPLLIVVDGSGCVGHKRPDFAQLLSPAEFPQHAFARLVVGKSGVPAEQASGDNCSDQFLRHYAVDDRVIDHLRVMLVATRDADWWNGELLIFGWSDGGDIAAQIFALNPTISKLAFGGVGGGLSMAEHFEDYWACGEGQTEDRDACLADLHAQFEKMESNPTWMQQWSGPDNSFKAWQSRLKTKLTPVLADERRPMLMVHGANDISGAPVQSARKLAQDVAKAGQASLEYWEIDGMEHGVWSLPPEQAIQIEERILAWLLRPAQPGE